MYIARLTYLEGENTEEKVITFVAQECSVSLNAGPSNCRFALEYPLSEELELFATKDTKVLYTELLNENEVVIYNSRYWTNLESINVQYPAEGQIRSEMYLIRQDT